MVGEIDSFRPCFSFYQWPHILLSDIHPDKVTRVEENGNVIQMSIFEYLFIHGQRFQDRKVLRPINTHRYSRSKQEKEEKDQASDRENLRLKDIGEKNKKMKLYQRALGTFNRIVVKNGTVTCNCENFRRFGKCEDSELVGFIALGKGGYPKSTDVDFNDCKLGFEHLSKELRKKVCALVGNTKDVAVRIPAPVKDPFYSLQQLRIVN